MKWFMVFLQFSFLTLYLSGCDILENSSATLMPLESKINFKVVESYQHYETVAVPKIFIKMVTEKIYPCFNYSISTQFREDGRKLIVQIFGIEQSVSCATAFGPANGVINLGYRTGIYEIEFNGYNFNDKYNLMITDSLIILDGKETLNMSPSVHFVYRYPKNSFAYIWSKCATDSLIFLEFIDTLKSVINLNELLFSDLAEIPYPITNEYRNVNYFKYDSNSDFSRISSIMKSYKQAHFPNNEVIISIQNWMNKKIRSSLL